MSSTIRRKCFSRIIPISSSRGYPSSTKVLSTYTESITRDILQTNDHQPSEDALVSSPGIGDSRIHEDYSDEHRQTTSSRGRRRFALTNDGFQLDDKKVRIHAGEIHYFRIPSCRWQDRLRKLRNSGLNAVSTAIEWALHEPRSEIYEWDGDANFTRFIDLARELQLFAIVRAGPFIGADRDLGGLPGWLLTINKTEDRPWMHRSSLQYRFYVERWLSRLLPKISDMLVSNGGPIVMIQIDSDFGASGPCGSADWLYDIFVSYLGNDAVLFTMENNVYQKLLCGTIQNVLPGFRTHPEEYFDVFNGSVSELFYAIGSVAPAKPRIVELKTGRAWAWGEKLVTFGANEVAETLHAILSKEASVILYMFAGGTNYERAGNAGNDTMGLITSYYYDALLDETGDATEKFFAIRSILATYRQWPLMEPVLSSNSTRNSSFGKLKFESLGSLLDPEVFVKFNLSPLTSERPLTFAEVGTAFGPVLYETHVPRDYRKVTAWKRGAILRCTGIRDRAYVYVDKRFAGIMNRGRHFALVVDPSHGQILRILVESQGYVAHGTIGDDKGIASNVFLDSIVLKNWTMYSMDFLNDASELQFITETLNTRPPRKRGNGLYRTSFVLPEGTEGIPHDSFLDVGKFGKGQAYLNSRMLGKFWPMAGPQQSLYLPGCLVKPYPLINQLLIVEMQRPLNRQTNETESTFIHHKIWIKETRALSLTNSPSKTIIILLTSCNYLTYVQFLPIPRILTARWWMIFQ